MHIDVLGDEVRSMTDTRLIVEAMAHACSLPRGSHFVIASGDSDFVPLVSKLQELGHVVVGASMQNSTSVQLMAAVDNYVRLDTRNVVAVEIPQQPVAAEPEPELAPAPQLERERPLWETMSTWLLFGAPSTESESSGVGERATMRRATARRPAAQLDDACRKLANILPQFEPSSIESIRAQCLLAISRAGEQDADKVISYCTGHAQCHRSRDGFVQAATSRLQAGGASVRPVRVPVCHGLPSYCFGTGIAAPSQTPSSYGSKKRSSCSWCELYPRLGSCLTCNTRNGDHHMEASHLESSWLLMLAIGFRYACLTLYP